PEENGPYNEIIEKYGATAKTSQAPMSAYLTVFNELIRAGYDILCIAMSSRLSGTYSSALAAARAVSHKRIKVVDSLTTVYGQYLLTEKAVELIRQGKRLLEVAQELELMRNKIGLVFSVDNIDALRRGGRLSIVRQSVSTILNVRPILLCKDGVIVADGNAKGKSALIRELLARIPKNAVKIGIMNMNTQDIADELYNRLKALHPKCLVEHWNLGPVIGIHLGPVAIGLGWIIS
ncbi:MAG TPA: DegV family protein, partial [Clostridia bacterium]|nr:DegV family protein [Clostridia bacterium]